MNDASALRNDKEIIQYITSHANAFEFNSVRAVKKRDELLRDACQLAQEEISAFEQYKNDNILKYKTKSSVNTVFQVIID